MKRDDMADSLTAHDQVDVYLATERLILRRFTADDAALLFDLDSEPEVLRYLARTPPSRDEIERRILPEILAAYERDPRFGRWAALDRQSGAFLGRFGLGVVGNDDRTLSLGYRLRRAAWGRGLATEGGRALIDRAFAEFRARRVRAQTMAVNLASRRVMEKCGMRYVRTFHVHFDDPLPGTGHGEVEYEIRYEDWQAARQRTAP
jgi:RimJ/RimL family protein N-acetyltransferase